MSNWREHTAQYWRVSYNLDDLRWPGRGARALALETSAATPRGTRSRLSSPEPQSRPGKAGQPANMCRLPRSGGRPGAATPVSPTAASERRFNKRAAGCRIDAPSPAAINHRALPSLAARNASSFFHYAPTLGRELPAVERLPVESLSRAPGAPQLVAALGVHERGRNEPPWGW